MAGLFDPPTIGGGGAVPAMPGAVPNAGFGSGTFTDLLNTLSGNANGSGFDMAGLNSGLQSLAYGIGSFAKNPQTRAMYVQAAAAHAQHKQSSAAEDYKTLLSIAPQFESLLKQAAGNPQAAAALQPMLDHYTQNLDIAARRAGKDVGLGASLNDYFKAVAASPAESQPAESDIGKVMDDLRKGHINQAQADDRIKQLSGLNSAPRTREYMRGATRVYEEQLPDGTWRELGSGPAFAPPQQTNINMPGIEISYDANGRPVIGMGGAAGMPGGKGKLDEGQRKALGLFNSASGEIPTLMKTFDSLANLPDQAASYVPVIGNYVQSEDYQRAKNAIGMIIQSSLYSVSGAQFNDKEYARRMEAVMPQPGDKPKTIADKRARLQGYVDSIQYNLGLAPQADRPNLAAPPAAGPVAPQPPPMAAPSNTPSAQDPLGLFR